GPARFGLPSASRGMPGVGKSIHWAPAGGRKAIVNAAATRNGQPIFIVVPLTPNLDPPTSLKLPDFRSDNARMQEFSDTTDVPPVIVVERRHIPDRRGFWRGRATK